MTDAPVIREAIVTETDWRNGREIEVPHKLRVYGGLHFIKGNSAPYFSLTYWVGGNNGHGGAGHEYILERYPELADLAALHLSDDKGAPMHATENGFYQLGGCTQFRKWPYAKPDAPYGANYAHVASHFRISEDEARALPGLLFGEHFSEAGGFLTAEAEKRGKMALAVWVETQRARWADEAQACIAKHGLVVYGD